MGELKGFAYVFGKGVKMADYWVKRGRGKENRVFASRENATIGFSELWGRRRVCVWMWGR